jgi:hypothetical protein
MLKNKQSIKKVNELLFYESEEFDDDTVDTSQSNTESRLLKQKQFLLDQELEEVPYYKKPFVQAAVVGVIALPLGWGIISAFNPSESTQAQQSSVTRLEERENQILKNSLAQEREKNQNLIVERGLKTQRTEVVRAEPKPSQPSPKPDVESSPHPQPVATKVVNSAPPSTPPPRPIVSAEQTSKALVNTSSIVRPASPSASTKQSPRIPQDPMKQWLIAANSGKYGQGVVSDNSSKTSTENLSDAQQTEDLNDIQQVDNEVLTAQTFNWQPTGGTGTPLVNEASLISNQQFNNSLLTKNILVGSKATGKLETPIVWSGKPGSFHQKYLVKLTESLFSTDKSVAIPKGAYLTAQVNEATETGLIQMYVTSILITGQEQTLEKPIPKGAIILLGKGGRQLKAAIQQQNRSSSDLEMALLSGIANAAGSINAPRSQTVFGSGSYSTTTTNRNPNHLAAFGQGAAQSIVQQMQLRNQRSQQSQSTVLQTFILDAGTTVQIFVNQSLQL